VNRRKAEAALIGNTIVWGATFVLVKAAISEISPLLFLAIRFSLATVILLSLAAARRNAEVKRKPNTAPYKQQLAAGALCGLFLFTGYVFQTLGLRLTSAPKAAFLTGMTSVVAPFLAALVYKIRPQRSEVLGVLVATVGLGLMTLQGAIGSMSRGDLLTLACAVGFAAHIVTVGHFSEQMSFQVLSVAQIAAAAALFLGCFWWMERPQVTWRPVVICAILITGTLATALAFTIQAWAQQYTTATRTAVIFMLEPVFAWITSYFVAGEGLSARGAAGAALILGGVWLVEMKPLNAENHPS
jgi:drug/metabolite transporter (DMT)-like permease